MGWYNKNMRKDLTHKGPQCSLYKDMGKKRQKTSTKAEKEPKKSVVMRIRCSAELLAKITAQAEIEGHNLSAWVRHNLTLILGR